MTEMVAIIGGVAGLAGVASTIVLAVMYTRERTKATDAALLMNGYKTELATSQAEMKEKTDENKKLNAALSVVRAERDEERRKSVAAESDAGARARLARARVPRADESGNGSSAAAPTGPVSPSAPRKSRPRK